MIDRFHHQQPGPLRRMVDVASVGTEGLTLSVEATEAECRALADANGLVAVRSFVAELRFDPEGRVGIGVTGEVRAIVRQTCVVTLDAFESERQEPVSLHFLPERELDVLRAGARHRHDAALGSEAQDGEGEEDLPDPIVNGRIDAGAVASEFFTLGLDPHPRKPDASFPDPVEDDAVVSPFAALASLRDMKDT